MTVSGSEGDSLNERKKWDKNWCTQKKEMSWTSFVLQQNQNVWLQSKNTSWQRLFLDKIFSLFSEDVLSQDISVFALEIFFSKRAWKYLK